MIKNLLISTFYAFITFCVISYFSVMVSLLQSIGGAGRKPVSNLGFPFKYYYQFWLSGSDSPNCGWDIKNFFLDAIITWIVVLIIYAIIVKKKKHAHNIVL